MFITDFLSVYPNIIVYSILKANGINYAEQLTYPIV